MSDNTALIERFYAAFAQRDAAGMSACYHPDVRFSDPAFPDLKGIETAAMWHMLCERGADLRVEHSAVQASGDSGSAHWEAWYTFSTTGRSVHNIIDASFRFQDGRIIEHRDVFDFSRWSKQALGAPGYLLGWSGFLRNKVQTQADKGLRIWMSKHDGGAGLIPPL